MGKYQLVYFNARGKTEVSRFLFAQAGVAYEDKRVTREEWAAMKPDTPSGELPMLVIDGRTKLPQSMAIARLLAREFSLYGANNLEAAQIDSLCDFINELVDAGVNVMFAGDDAAVKAKALERFKTKSEAVVKILDKALADNKSGWLVGSNVSLADFLCYGILDLIKNLDVGGFAAVFNANSRLKAHAEKVSSLPKIKEWIAKRPVTEH